MDEEFVVHDIKVIAPFYLGALILQCVPLVLFDNHFYPVCSNVTCVCSDCITAFHDAVFNVSIIPKIHII